MSEPRLAVDSDALRFKQWQGDFFRSIGKEFRLPTVAQIRSRHKQQSIIAVVSDKAICEIKVDEKSQGAKVEVLLPRGVDAEFWVPVLSWTLVETWGRFPQPKWWIWAQPFAGVDELGKLDGGKSECERWVEMYPSAQMFEDAGAWWAGATFGDVMLPLVRAASR